MEPVPTQGPTPELSSPQPVHASCPPRCFSSPLVPPVPDSPAPLSSSVPPWLRSRSSSQTPPQASPPPARPCETEPMASLRASKPMTPPRPVSPVGSALALPWSFIPQAPSILRLPHSPSPSGFHRRLPAFWLHLSFGSSYVLAPSGVTRAPFSILVPQASGSTLASQSFGVTLDHCPLGSAWVSTFPGSASACRSQDSPGRPTKALPWLLPPSAPTWCRYWPAPTVPCQLPALRPPPKPPPSSVGLFYMVLGSVFREGGVMLGLCLVSLSFHSCVYVSCVSFQFTLDYPIFVALVND